MYNSCCVKTRQNAVAHNDNFHMYIYSSFFCSILSTLFFSLSLSDGPDLLEGHGANRHGANRVSRRSALPVPAQHHHCGLHSLPGCHVLHRLSSNLLPRPLHPQLGRWRTPLQVREVNRKMTQYTGVFAPFRQNLVQSNIYFLLSQIKNDLDFTFCLF